MRGRVEVDVASDPDGVAAGHGAGDGDRERLRPLTPAVFHILLALSRDEHHGYAIMKQVESDSERRVPMGAGTLYGSLRRMLDAGLIRESDKRVDPALDDERRIYYAISTEGRDALATELARYERVVELARENQAFAMRSGHVT